MNNKLVALKREKLKDKQIIDSTYGFHRRRITSKQYKVNGRKMYIFLRGLFTSCFYWSKRVTSIVDVIFDQWEWRPALM